MAARSQIVGDDARQGHLLMAADIEQHGVESLHTFGRIVPAELHTLL